MKPRNPVRRKTISITNALAVVICNVFVVNVGLAANKPAGKDGVCAEDVKKFCSSVKPGGGRVYQCLTGHNAELAPACRDGLAAAKARYEQFA